VRGVGYLIKERVSEIAVLVDALRRVADGETVVDSAIVARLLRHRLHGLLRVSREGPSETRQVRPHRQTSSASSASRRVLRSSKAEARRLACSGLGRLLLLFVHSASAAVGAGAS
jgi:hypothetical protein